MKISLHKNSSAKIFANNELWYSSLYAVSYTVVITPSGTPTAGQTYSLSCSLTGTNNAVTYQWLDSNGTHLTNVSQLEFPILRASDVGLYTCRATVGSVVVVQTATVNISCK